MHLALVAMPWTYFDCPSPALSVLKRFLDDSGRGYRVSCHSAFLDVYGAIPDLYSGLSNSPMRAELLYTPLLYPERTEQVRQTFQQWQLGAAAAPSGQTAERGARFDAIMRVLEEHAEALSAELAAGGYDVVGFTTTFGQLFASLAIAARLKHRRKETVIVLGGQGVADAIGPSLLQEYPFIDHIVQGEGELPLLALLDGLVQSRAGAAGQGAVPGVLSRGGSSVSLQQLRRPVEHSDFAASAAPDFAEYAARAEALAIPWQIPLEGSRGCWWDRVRRTDNERNTCYFCGIASVSYREKPVERLVEQMNELTRQHQNVRYIFLDNILRHGQVLALADSLLESGIQFDYFYELRASVTPYELLRLWESGCSAIQFGIESLSTAYLKRIGKGTTTIQNLQAMKIAFELGIQSVSNILTEFPGATTEEVAEMAHNIRRYGICYEPLQISPFGLQLMSTAARMPASFGIRGVRNAALFQAGLPAQVWERLRLFWLDFELDAPQIDWSPVEQACVEWRALHQSDFVPLHGRGIGPLRPLQYIDGGTFLKLLDYRDESVLTLMGLAREVYLYCCEIRSEAELLHVFQERGPAAMKIVQDLLAQDLMFAEGGKLLSLAVAHRPQLAAERIRAAWEARQKRDRSEASLRRPRRLPVVQATAESAKGGLSE